MAIPAIPLDVSPSRGLADGRRSSAGRRLVSAGARRHLEPRLRSLGLGRIGARPARIFPEPRGLWSLCARCHRSGLLGTAGTASRAHQPWGRGLCHYHHRILFLHHDGQTRPLRLARRLRPSVSSWRLETGATPPQTRGAHRERRTMKPMTKAVAVALIQVLIVCSLGAKLLYDRSTRPRAWFKTEKFDPNLPIRGRYVQLQVEVNDPRSPEEIEKKFKNEIEGYDNQQARRGLATFYQFGRECGNLEVRGETPIPVFDASASGWNCDN